MAQFGDAEHLIRDGYDPRASAGIYAKTTASRPEQHTLGAPSRQPRMNTQNRPTHLNTHINPTPAYAMAMSEAIQNNNEGLALKRSGQYAAAEQKYLKALDIKLKHIGEKTITTALSHNALGELYIAMNRLDDAEKHLEIAVKIRNADGPTFDAATSRENLAIVYEMRGNLLAAKQMRKSTGMYACGNYDVSLISYLPLAAPEGGHRLQCPGQVFNKNELKHCGKCTVCLSLYLPLTAVMLTL